MAYTPAFQFTLTDKVEVGTATIGKFDGKTPSLTAATTGGKVFMYNPYAHEAGGGEKPVRYLNINKQITSICAGPLDPALDHDVLLVGTPADLMCYNVESNSELFFKDLPDGASRLACGRAGTAEHPTAIVGGNCSIQGFDATGSEVFWTVNGDNVSALEIADINGDGVRELLVGSEDFEVRALRDDEVLWEVSEADRVNALAHVQAGRFGYALSNGTVGCYDGTARQWRVKSKYQPTALVSFDLDLDGVPELVSGWSNGKVEVRRAATGDVAFRTHAADGSAVAGLLRADYRLDGKDALVVATEGGEARRPPPYAPARHIEAASNSLTGFTQPDPAARDAAAAAAGGAPAAAHISEETLVDLQQKKAELLAELANYTRGGLPVSGSAHGGLDGAQSLDPNDVVPTDTQVSSRLEARPEKGGLELVLESNNECVIKAVAVFAEQLFEGESLLRVFKAASTEARVPLLSKRDVACDVSAKVIVGLPGGRSFQAVDVDLHLGKFAMYLPVKEPLPEPQGRVAFRLTASAGRFAAWADETFGTMLSAAAEGSGALRAQLLCLRTAKPLRFDATPHPQGGLDVLLLTDDLDAAADVVQDCAAACGVAELDSQALFPLEAEAFRNTLLRVDESNAVRMKLAAEVADASNNVKALIARAEDARLLGDMRLMRRLYTALFDLNRELAMEHEKRATNHTQLVEGLKEVNQMIQRAAKLRVGQAKTRVVNSCRAAIKANNLQALFKHLGLSGGGVLAAA